MGTCYNKGDLKTITLGGQCWTEESAHRLMTFRQNSRKCKLIK